MNHEKEKLPPMVLVLYFKGSTISNKVMIPRARY